MWERLSVEVQGEAIVVSLPGTDFAVTYARRADGAGLALTKSWVEPSTTSPTIAQFRVRALHAALDKARELGWIV
jgi:hypothetical protein